jgi:transposase
MRFVEPKTAEQQSRAILFRARERLVRQRTELINALRACLYEYGHIIPQGAHQIKRVAEILDTPNSDLPALMREECAELLEQIAEQTVRINARTTKIKALAVEADTARRLQTIPGVGPLTALAVEAFVRRWRTSSAAVTLPPGSVLFRVSSLQAARNGSGASRRRAKQISAGC